jgi:predicted RNA-binding protein with EMAP domain
VSVEVLDADIWAKVVLILSTDALMMALTARTLQGQDTSGQERLREQIETHTAIIGKLQRRRHSYMRMAADADDGEMADDARGQVKATSDLIANHERERDQLQAQLEQMEGAAQLEQMLAKLPDAVMTSRLPDGGIAFDMVMQGPTVESVTSKEAVVKELHRRWAKAVQTASLDVEAKRAILRYLGARVEVFRSNDPRPESGYPGDPSPKGCHWEFWTALESASFQDMARLAAARDAKRADNTSLKL